MSSGKNQYVVTRGDKWAVRGEGNERPTRVFDTQREAINYGRGIARNQESELRIQGRDSRFREAYPLCVIPPMSLTRDLPVLFRRPRKFEAVGPK